MWRFIKGRRSASESIDTSRNRVFRLDGVNDYITVPNSSVFNVGLGEFTFAFKYFVVKEKPTSSGWIPLFRKRGTSGAGYGFHHYLSSSDKPVFFMIDSGGNTDNIYFNNSDIPNNTWITLCIRRKGDNYQNKFGANFATSVRNADNLEFFVNGTKITPASYALSAAGQLVLDIDNTTDFLIGTQVGADQAWAGYFDFAAIYNRALSNGEVADLQNYLFSPSGAKALWNFNENSGDTCFDSSSAGNNALRYNNTESALKANPLANGIIFYLKNSTNVVKTFTPLNDVTITQIVRFNNITSASYSTDNVTFTTLTFTSDVATVSINLIGGQPLYLKASTNSGTTNAVLQLNY